MTNSKQIRATKEFEDYVKRLYPHVRHNTDRLNILKNEHMQFRIKEKRIESFLNGQKR